MGEPGSLSKRGTESSEMDSRARPLSCSIAVKRRSDRALLTRTYLGLLTMSEDYRHGPAEAQQHTWHLSNG